MCLRTRAIDHKVYITSVSADTQARCKLMRTVGVATAMPCLWCDLEGELCGKHTYLKGYEAAQPQSLR